MTTSDLIVNFIGRDQSLSKVASNAGQTVEKNLGSAVQAGAKIGTAALAGLGVAVVGTGAKLVSLGSDAEEMLGKFNVVFAQTGGQVTEQLEAFGEAVGRSKFELMEMAATFGDTFKPMGFAEQEAADLSVTMTELAADLGSFNNMEMDEALRRLQGTLIGSHENALDFGVIINENTLKAELAAQGWDNLTGAQLEQAKVQARINLLMAGTTDAQGNAALTAGSWANQIRGLQATLTDIGTELGMELLPAITPLLGMFKELALSIVPVLRTAFALLVPILGFLVDHMNIIGPLVTIIAAGFASWVILSTVITWVTGAATAITALSAAVTAAGGGLAGLATVITGPLLAAWGTMTAALTAALPAIGAVIVAISPVILIVGAIAAVVALFAVAWNKNWFDIQGRTSAVVGFLKGLFDDFVAGLRIMWAFIQDNILPIFQAWNNFIDSVFNYTLRVLGGIWETYILPPMQAVASFISDKLGPAFQWLKDKLIDPLVDAFSRLGDMITGVGDYFNNLAENINNLELPPWLTPGSPTPLEIGLVGIRESLRGLNQQELPAFSNNLQGLNSQVDNSRVANITNNITTSRVDVSPFNRTQAAFANGGI